MEKKQIWYFVSKGIMTQKVSFAAPVTKEEADEIWIEDGDYDILDEEYDLDEIVRVI